VSEMVSVVVPTRNRLSLLMESVTSVSRQGYPAWELIIVNDASTDGTQGWLDKLIDPRISSLLLTGHSERSMARNRGLDRARGDYVLFLDDDDMLLPHALSYLVNLIQGAPGAVASVGGAEVFSVNGIYRGARPWRRRFAREPWLDAIGGWCALVGQTLFRTQHLQSLGGFKSTMTPSEDQELWLRAGRHPVVFGSRRVLRVRTHQGQGSKRNVDPIDLQLRMRMEFVESLPAKDRVRASAAIKYWLHARSAQRAYTSGDLRQYWKHTYRAAHASPTLLLSPLMRPGMVRKLTKSMLPSRVLGRLRMVRASLGYGVVRSTNS